MHAELVASVCIVGGWCAGAAWYGPSRNPPLQSGEMGTLLVFADEEMATSHDGVHNVR